MSLACSLRTRLVVRHRSCLFAGLLLGAMSVAHATAPPTLTVNTLSDSSGSDCTSTCSLREAIANIAPGGTIDFEQALLPGVITLGAGQLAIPAKSLTIQGPGAAQLAISANGLSRVLQIGDGMSYVEVNLAGVSLRDGKESGGNGGDGASGSGLGGQSGGPIDGGCILIRTGSLTLDDVDIRNCVAQGGTGGSGGTGAAGSGLVAGGLGGDGGQGGIARGAGIFGGNLTLHNSSLTNAQAIGGAGGAGGDGGSGFFRGPGGKGGRGGDASGGAIDFYDSSLSIDNATIAGSVAISGDGGNGGNGDNSLISSPGGNGGNGGDARGGLLLIDGSFTVAELEFTTLANGNAASGAVGKGGAGKVGGAEGQPGSFDANAIWVNGLNTTKALSTIIVGTGATATTSLCGGYPIVFTGANLAEDYSCSVPSLIGSFAQLFRPPDPNMPRPAYMPLYHSAVIDAAATCDDLTVQAVTADQHGTPRPQGSACDLGAIEADYIFVSGLD